MWLWEVTTEKGYEAVNLYTPIQEVFSTKLFPVAIKIEICWADFSSCTQIIFFIYVKILSFQIRT